MRMVKKNKFQAERVLKNVDLFAPEGFAEKAVKAVQACRNEKGLHKSQYAYLNISI